MTLYFSDTYVVYYIFLYLNENASLKYVNTLQ